MAKHPDNLPVYSITVNHAAFVRQDRPQCLNRLQQVYIPEYWRKMQLDQKVISASSQDRLCELTTKQIDRIIDMERIRSVLYDKKAKIGETTFSCHLSNNQHCNVYEANFLAKVNEIAIKRNIRHENMEEFGEYERGKDKAHNKSHNNKETSRERAAAAAHGDQAARNAKIVQSGCKYVKKYTDKKTSKIGQAKPNCIEDDGEKSIASIEADLDSFELKIYLSNTQQKGTATHKNAANRGNETGHAIKRWFRGMSLHYVNQSKPEPKSSVQYERIAGIDISAEMEDLRSATQVQFAKPHAISFSTGISYQPDSKSTTQNYKFKVRRVSTMS